MNIFYEMLERFHQFQQGFSKILKDLQDEANNYKNCYNKANNDIMDYYNKLSQSTKMMNQQNMRMNQEQLQCNNSLEMLKQHKQRISQQLNIFNDNVFQYKMEKLEFDNFYQQIILMEDQGIKQFQYYCQLAISPVQLDFQQFISEMNSLVQKQNYQFNRNEELNNYIQQQTNLIKNEIQAREQQQKLLQKQIQDEQQKQLESIQKQKEELQKQIQIDTEKFYNDENLSETEELTQICQECGQLIKFNNFLTKCLHHYHEQCILQKIKANYQQTSIYCSCNTLINSRMIKDVLDHSQQDQNSISFEMFQQYQIKQLLKKSNKNFTECRCGFLYISEEEKKLENCISCENSE